MGAKVEMGNGWLCTELDSGLSVVKQTLATELAQPVELKEYGSTRFLNLTQGDTEVKIHTGQISTNIGIQYWMEGKDLSGLSLLVATGQVMQWNVGLRGEARDEFGADAYTLIGKEASIQFGNQGSPEYLKVVNEINRKGKLISS